MNYKNDFELSGAEDPAILSSYVTALAPIDGYREGMTVSRAFFKNSSVWGGGRRRGNLQEGTILYYTILY